MLINDLTPNSREQAVAFTKLEESIMWANAGIARNELAPPNDWQQRVRDEKRELDAKLDRLTSCLSNPDFAAKITAAEFPRLREQENYMRLYSSVLAERIAAFEK